MQITKDMLVEGFPGLIVATGVGIFGYFIAKQIIPGLPSAIVALILPLKDALILSLILGMLIRLAIGPSEKITPGLVLAPFIAIPVGVIFYGAKNLNFVKFSGLLGEHPGYGFLIILIMVVYFVVIFYIGKVLRLKDAITYLLATGSAICGASAIAITSPAVKADPDDVSLALVPIAVVAMIALYTIFPWVATVPLNASEYAALAGMTLEFTGFVKATTGTPPAGLNADICKKETGDIDGACLRDRAVSIKAFRFLGLLIAIPLFASLVRGKVYVPWYLWAFLLAGLISSYMTIGDKSVYDLTKGFLGPAYGILWSIAMAAIGLNADIRLLFTRNGLMAALVAAAGLIAALITFFMFYPSLSI